MRIETCLSQQRLSLGKRLFTGARPVLVKLSKQQGALVCILFYDFNDLVTIQPSFTVSFSK